MRPARPPFAPPLAALLLVACGEPGPDARQDPTGARAKPTSESAVEPSPASQPGSTSLDGLRPGPPTAPRFATRRELEARAKPESVAAADLDGDGRAELVALAMDPGELLVWRGATGGPSATPARVAIDAWPLAPLLLPAQRFGSPRPRLALASRSTRAVQLVEPLSGASEVWCELPGAPRAGALGDLGADGVLELAFACDGRALVTVDESRATSVLALPHALPRCIALLADGQGLVVGFQDSQSLVCFARGADGELRLERELALPGFPRRVAELDLDHDGDDELLVLGGDRGAWVFGWGEPGGSRAWRAQGATRLDWSTSKVPLDLARGDFDGDGRADLALLAFADLEAALWCDFERSGPRAASFGYVGQSALSLAAGDFDGDRALDLAVANRDAARVSVVRGLGGGALEWPALADVATFPNAIACADLDGDGRAEGVTVSAKLCALDVVRWSGAGLERVSRLPIGPSAKALVLVDLDRDGKPDAAWISSDARGAQIELAFGDGTLAFATRASEPPLAIGPSGEDLLARDLDGDGLVELVAANAEADELCVFRRPSAAAPFAPEPARLALAPAPSALAPLAAPGELTVALAGPGERTGVARVALARDAGGAWRLAEREHVALRGVPLDVRAARLAPGDEAWIVLGSDSRDSANGWLRVVRRGAVAEQHVPGQRSARLACGDVDGDGHDDVLVASLNAHTLNLWLARDGRLAPEPNLGAGLGVLDVALGDADGDGRLDVFACDAFGDDAALIRNLGGP